MMDLISESENLTSSQFSNPARSCSQKSHTRYILPLSLLYGVAVCVCGGGGGGGVGEGGGVKIMLCKRTAIRTPSILTTPRSSKRSMNKGSALDH